MDEITEHAQIDVLKHELIIACYVCLCVLGCVCGFFLDLTQLMECKCYFFSSYFQDQSAAFLFLSSMLT